MKKKLLPILSLIVFGRLVLADNSVKTYYLVTEYQSEIKKEEFQTETFNKKVKDLSDKINNSEIDEDQKKLFSQKLNTIWFERSLPELDKEIDHYLNQKKAEKEELLLKKAEEEKALPKKEVTNNPISGDVKVVDTSDYYRSVFTEATEPLTFDSEGLLVRKESTLGQEVINLLFAIPGGKDGAWHHIQYNTNNLIDQLSSEEAVWVIWRVEGPGFGQSAAGLAGIDSPETHRIFVQEQINGRFGGNIKNLLKAWGTYTYNGY